jgi:hypothetical protein
MTSISNQTWQASATHNVKQTVAAVCYSSASAVQICTVQCRSLTWNPDDTGQEFGKSSLQLLITVSHLCLVDQNHPHGHLLAAAAAAVVVAAQHPAHPAQQAALDAAVSKPKTRFFNPAVSKPKTRFFNPLSPGDQMEFCTLCFTRQCTSACCCTRTMSKASSANLELLPANQAAYSMLYMFFQSVTNRAGLQSPGTATVDPAAGPAKRVFDFEVQQRPAVATSCY